MGLVKTADITTPSVTTTPTPTPTPTTSTADALISSMDAGSAATTLESFSKTVGKHTSSLGRLAVPALAVVAGGFIIKQILDKMHNDVRKTRIIEDLALNDPLLRTVDKRQLYHWYATLCYYAPTLANDKLTVTEVLQNFARFGKVDFNTIKMLVDTEKSVSDTTKNRSENLKNMKTLFTPWK